MGLEKFIPKGLPGGANEIKFSKKGYKRNSPDVNKPFNIIDSGSITMENVGKRLLGIDNKGNKQVMEPGINYQFPGDQVLEIPIAQTGGTKKVFKPAPSFEDKVNYYLGYPMTKAKIIGEMSAGKDNDAVDNIRHPLAGMFTTQGLMNKGLDPITAFMGANALGIGHEITSPNTEDGMSWWNTIREGAEDVFNNMVGAGIGIMPGLTDAEKIQMIQKLSYANKLPDGYDIPQIQGQPKHNMYFKKYGGNYDEIELDDEEVEEYRRGGFIVEELPEAQDGKTIFTNDPNDPRLRNYNDSLLIHNYGEDLMKLAENSTSYDDYIKKSSEKYPRDSIAKVFDRLNYNEYNFPNSLYRFDDDYVKISLEKYPKPKEVVKYKKKEENIEKIESKKPSISLDRDIHTEKREGVPTLPETMIESYTQQWDPINKKYLQTPNYAVVPKAGKKYTPFSKFEDGGSLPKAQMGKEQKAAYKQYKESVGKGVKDYLGKHFAPDISGATTGFGADNDPDKFNCIGSACNFNKGVGADIPIIAGNSNFWDQADRNKIPVKIYADAKNEDYEEALKFIQPGDFIGHDEGAYGRDRKKENIGRNLYFPEHTNIFLRWDVNPHTGEKVAIVMDGNSGVTPEGKPYAYTERSYKYSELLNPKDKRLFLGRPTRVNGVDLEFDYPKYANPSYFPKVSEETLAGLKPLKWSTNKQFKNFTDLNDEQRNNLKVIAETLTKKKKDFIKATGMSEEDYDQIAGIMPGLAYQETKLGKTDPSSSTFQVEKNLLSGDIKDAVKTHIEGLGQEYGSLTGKWTSKGMFQVKEDLLFAAPETRIALKRLGITKDNYDPSNKEHNLLASMVWFDNTNKTSTKNFDKVKGNDTSIPKAAKLLYYYNNKSIPESGEAWLEPGYVKNIMDFNPIKPEAREDSQYAEGKKRVTPLAKFQPGGMYHDSLNVFNSTALVERALADWNRNPTDENEEAYWKAQDVNLNVGSSFRPEEIYWSDLNAPDGNPDFIARYKKPQKPQQPTAIEKVKPRGISINTEDERTINTTLREGVPALPETMVETYTQQWDSVNKKYIQKPHYAVVPKAGKKYTPFSKFEDGGESTEDKLDKKLNSPMLRARDFADLNPGEEDPVDSLRHSAAGLYTANALANKTGNIPWLSKAIGIGGASVLGAAHEIANINLPKDPKAIDYWYAAREAGEDIFNNTVGAFSSLIPTSEKNQAALLKRLAVKNKLPDGYGDPKANMYFKKHGGAYEEIELSPEEIEEYRRGGFIVEELPQTQDGLSTSVNMGPIPDFSNPVFFSDDKHKSGVPLPTSEQSYKNKGSLKKTVKQPIVEKAYDIASNPLTALANSRNGIPDYMGKAIETGNLDRNALEMASDVLNPVAYGNLARDTYRDVEAGNYGMAALNAASMIPGLGVIGEGAGFMDDALKLGVKGAFKPGKTFAKTLGLSDRTEELFEKAYKVAKTNHTLDDYANELAAFEEIQNNFAKKYSGVDMERRFGNLGISPKDIPNKPPKLTFDVGEGSHYNHLKNIINIDFAEMKALKQIGYELNPKNVYEHELGHFFQHESTKQLPEIKKILRKYEEQLSSHETLKKIHGEKELDTYGLQPPTRPRYDLANTRLDDYARTIEPVLPRTEWNIGQMSPKNNRIMNDASYFRSGVEPLAHIREFRQGMLDQGFLKSIDTKVTNSDIMRFISENPKDRISGFINPTEKNLNKLKHLINSAPAVVPIAVGAGLMNEQDGGEYQELDLSPDEIEQYRKGGFIVEELPKAQEGEEIEESMQEYSDRMMKQIFGDNEKEKDSKAKEKLNLLNSNTVDKQKEFLQRMINSPLYKERYSKMTGVSDSDLIEKSQQESLENINSLKFTYNLKDFPKNVSKAAKKMDAYAFYAPGNHTIWTPENASDEASARLHEMSHGSTRGDLKTKEPYFIKPEVKTENNSEKESIWLTDYLQEPTEIKSRVDVSRKFLEDRKLYDPVNNRFTEKEYDELKNNMWEDGNIFDLINSYSKDDVIRMFNEIVQEPTVDENALPQAQKGGANVNYNTPEYNEAYEQGQVTRYNPKTDIYQGQDLPTFEMSAKDTRVADAVRKGTGEFAQDYVVPAAKMAAGFTPLGPLVGLTDAAVALSQGDTFGGVLGAGMEALPYGIGKVLKSPLTKSALKGVPKNAPKSIKKELTKPLPNSGLKKELEPYLSKRKIPYTKEEEVYNSFLSNESRLKKDLKQTINYDAQGNIKKYGGEFEEKELTPKQIKNLRDKGYIVDIL